MTTIPIPLCDGSYVHVSTDVNSQRTVNMYPMSAGQLGLASPPNQTVLVQTMGLLQNYVFSGTICRGLWTFSDGNTYTVIGPSVYKLAIDSATGAFTTVTLIGTLNTEIGTVHADQNPTQILFVDGSTSGYCYNMFNTYGSVTIGPIGGTGGDTYNLIINGTPIYTAQNVSTALTLNALVTQINLFTGTTNITASGASGILTLEASDLSTITVVESGTGFTAGTDGITVARDSTTLSVGKFYTPLTPWYVLNQTDNNFYGGSACKSMDGYIFVAKPNSSMFYCSNLNDASVYNALNYSNAQAVSDIIMGFGVARAELWILCSKHTEVWYNAANPSGMPLSPLSGGIVMMGCAAADSIANINDAIMWLDPRGIVNISGSASLIRSLNTGAGTQALSDDATSSQFWGYGNNSNAIACVYYDRSHTMYQITFPRVGKTWVMDLSTNKWHERTSYNALSAMQDQHLIQFVTQNGQWLIGGSDTTNILYLMSHEYKTDNTYPIVRKVVTPPIGTHQKLTGIDELVLTIGTADATVYYPPTDPQMMCRFSSDGGHTYSNQLFRSMGLQGQYNPQIRWNRLGTAHQWRFEFECSEAIDFTIIEATIDIEETEL